MRHEHIGVHEKLILRSCLLVQPERSERKGKVKFIFGLFCGFKTALRRVLGALCFSFQLETLSLCSFGGSCSGNRFADLLFFRVCLACSAVIFVERHQNTVSCFVSAIDLIRIQIFWILKSPINWLRRYRRLMSSTLNGSHRLLEKELEFVQLADLLCLWRFVLPL